MAKVDGNASVTINAGSTIGSDSEKHNLYGGGLGASEETDVTKIAATDEYGTVYGGTKMTINGGNIKGNVYGGGAGVSGDATTKAADGKNLPHYMAAWVRRETEVHIQGGNIYGNIYAGGDLANSGWYTNALKPNEIITNKNGVEMPIACSIHLEGGEVFGEVFGGGNGRYKNYDGYMGSDYRTWHPELLGSICGSTYVKLDGATVWGRIYGGGQAGSIYSVEASANLHKASTDYSEELKATSGSTNVEILSGTAGHNIFGGGWGNITDNSGTDVITSADISGNTYVYFKEASIIEDRYIKGDGTFGEQNCSGSARKTESDVFHNLFGGGNVACVVGGSSYVYMIGAPSVSESYTSSLFYTTARKDVGIPHFSALGGGYGKEATIKKDANVRVDLVSGGLVYVIGGGLNGTVEGKTNVSVASDAGNSLIHGVYGGGYYAKVHKGTTVNITNANIMEDVFGGGALGNIGKTDDTSITLNISGGTIAGSVYGANDVSGTVEGLVKVNITGGTIMKNVYGAGNGDHTGYYEPGRGHYDVGENDNYYPVDHSGDTSTDGKGTVGKKGNTYKGRPQTPVGVEMYLAGATINGQVFGGGNSCTVGEWETNLSSKYGGDPHKWRDDPDFFKGGGKVNIKLGSGVTIGQDNEHVSADYKNDDGENVSGLFMGNNGANLATQTTKEDDYSYHHYYDKYTATYWPGFAVYKDNGELMDRTESLKSFNAYINNILMWTDDVKLEFEEGAENIWLANFVGGGFRGSMKAKTESKKYSYTLPSTVTIGNCVVGGAYNTDVVYRIYDTESDKHTYTEDGGHYLYLKNLDGMTEGTDYRAVEYGADGTTVKGIYRFVYDGGVLSNDEEVKENFSTLNLQCNFAGGEKARVFGGCYASGIIQGDAVVNYEATGAYDVYGGGALADVKGNTKVNLIDGTLTNAYGGGLGRLADDVKDYAPVAALVNGDATVTLGKLQEKAAPSAPDVYTASKVTGSIFGANNVNGTPLGHVKVHVLNTTDRGQANRNTAGTPASFDVTAVYGGGNQAAYIPSDETLADDEKNFAEVLIENCDNSIAYVYGGGNAAPVPATDVIIYGANAIDNAFAGGNGAGDDNPGADIGYKDYTRDDEHKYGSGESHITVYGGTVNNVYGGSNTLGYIRTHAYVDVPESDCPCPLVLGNVHAGGNQAEMYCGGSVTLACSEGADVVYAGANSADIHGNIDIVISSGTYGKVFGGNNSSGNVYGHIKVDIDETGCWPIMIGELYGCGNNAPYSVYGYNGDGSCKTSGEKLYNDPTINIISCTRIDKIFGGGNGTGATVYGNPNVNINTIKGRWAGKNVTVPFILDADGQRKENTSEIAIPNETGRIGNVYGGGNKAKVFGNTLVEIGTKTKNKHVSGTDTTTKDVSVTILGNVFGGSKGDSSDSDAGLVTGSTKVVIGE